MYCTGDPDRAPVRCTEPAGYAHPAAEAAFAALTALASGAPAARRRLDAGGRARREHGGARALPDDRVPRHAARREHRPHARDLADARRLRVVRPARRQGAGPEPRDAHQARRGDGIPPTRCTSQDWTTFNQNTATDETLAAIETDVAEYFARHTMQELYDIACETNLMLAPANSPREIYASAQLAARDFFGPVGDVERFPRRSSSCVPPTARPRRSGPTPVARRVAARIHGRAPVAAGTKAWDGVHILEFGAGAAGPIATRYFAEHGATVLRIESRTPARLPARLRARPEQPARPRGRADVRRAQRRQAQRHAQPEAPEGGRARAPARRRVGRRGRRELRAAGDEGLRARLRRARRDQARPRDDQRVPQRPDRSAQGLPRLRRPGLGARRLQRAHRLARPRARRPVRHDHRLARAALRRGRARGRAALPPAHRPRRLPRRRRRSRRRSTRSRRGCSTTRPTASHPVATATATARAFVHGAFPCADDGADGTVVGDRWVAIACVDRRPSCDRLHAITGADVAAWTRHPRAARGRRASCRPPGSRRCRSRTSATCTTIRSSRTAATSSRSPTRSSGPGLYERNGFRLSDATGGYDRAGPTLGQDQDWVLGELLGLDPDEQAALAADGVFD